MIQYFHVSLNLLPFVRPSKVLCILLILSKLVGLIIDNDETAYREEVRDLAVWCRDNNVSST